MMPGNTSAQVCIVGCGRWLRGDDQAGLLVAQALAGAELPLVRVILTESPCGDLPAESDGVRLLIVVDAAKPAPGVSPGTWTRIDYRRRPERIEPRQPAGDAHQLSVDAALGLAEQLGTLPPAVWVYAVALGHCDYGTELTPAVQGAVQELTQRIPADIAAWRMEKGGPRA